MLKCPPKSEQLCYPTLTTSSSCVHRHVRLQSSQHSAQLVLSISEVRNARTPQRPRDQKDPSLSSTQPCSPLRGGASACTVLPGRPPAPASPAPCQIPFYSLQPVSEIALFKTAPPFFIAPLNKAKGFVPRTPGADPQECSPPDLNTHQGQESALVLGSVSPALDCTRKAILQPLCLVPFQISQS